MLEFVANDKQMLVVFKACNRTSTPLSSNKTSQLEVTGKIPTEPNDLGQSKIVEAALPSLASQL